MPRVYSSALDVSPACAGAPDVPVSIFRQVGARRKFHRLLCPRRRLLWFSGNLFLMSSSVLRGSHPRSIGSMQSCRPMRRAIFSYTSSAEIGRPFRYSAKATFQRRWFCKLWLDNHVSRTGRPAPRAQDSSWDCEWSRLHDLTASKAGSVALLFLGTAFELLYIWKFDSAEGI